MASGSGNGWPRTHARWLLGTVVLLVLGIIVGMVLGSVWIGLLLAAIVSIGWLMAYESWRGGGPNLHDDDDDGARL